METTELYPPFTVGVDLGGTNTAFAIVDSVGHIVANDSIPTRTPTVEKWADNLASKISRMIADNILEGMIEGIGIGAPCANASTGCIEGATNLPWPSPIALVNMMESRTGLRTVISNDANAAAIGEMTYGAAAGLRNFIVLTLGTSVGGGIVCDGHLLSGRSGFAGELGHLIVKRSNGRLCGCGRTGCLEAYCSATGVARTAREFLEIRTEPSLLRNIPIDQITSKDVYDAAMQGDQIAKDIFEYTGTILGEAFADMTVFSSPQAFILFGGLSKSGELLLKPLRAAMDRNMMNVFKGKPKVLLSELKEADAAVLGASALGWEVKPIEQA